jgi:DNA-binding protein HU-beta
MAAGNQSRSDLVATIAGDHGVPQTQVDSIVRAYESHIIKSLAGGGEVRLAGFGNFKTSKRAARTGRNPQTGGTVKIPARTVARFSPAKALKDALEGKKGGSKGGAKAGAAKGGAKGGAAKGGAKSGAAKGGAKGGAKKGAAKGKK